MQFLNKVRKPAPVHSTPENVFVTIGIFGLGVVLRIFATYLNIHHAQLPRIMAQMDAFLELHGFLAEMALWILIGICVAVYCRTPVRAAVNVFAFFVGMAASYYIYSFLAAGAFPENHALAWIVLTLLSPLLGYLTWYAKGRGVFAVAISALALSVLFNCAFGYGWSYISVKRWLSVLMYVIGAGVLYRKSREMDAMLALSVVFAILWNTFLPFRLW